MNNKRIYIGVVIIMIFTFSSFKFSRKNFIKYEDFNSIEIIRDNNNLFYLKLSIANIVSSDMHAGIWTDIDKENKNRKTTYNIKCYWGLENKNAQVDDDIYIVPLPIKEIGTSETIDFYYAHEVLLSITSN